MKHIVAGVKMTPLHACSEDSEDALISLVKSNDSGSAFHLQGKLTLCFDLYKSFEQRLTINSHFERRMIFETDPKGLLQTQKK